MPERPMGGSRKFFAVAAAVICVFGVSGCRGCDQNILGIEGGTTLTGPDRVKPGETVEYEIGGSIGPNGLRCPKTVGLLYEELVGKSGTLLGTKTASKGRSEKIKVVKVKKQKGNNKPKCAMRIPVKVPIKFSPGRQDEHRVRLTATIYPPEPTPDQLPPTSDGIEGLGKLFALVAQGEAEKVVTVEGTAPTPGPGVNTPPTAAFIPSQEPALVGQPLGLDARVSKDADGQIVRYDWDLTSDGTFEKSSSSPTGVQVDSMAAPGQEITLRVTDDRGGQGIVKVPVRSSSSAIAGGSPTLTPEVTGANSPVTVGVKTTSPPSSKAELFCADRPTGTALTNPVDGQSFASKCSGPAGFNKVGVRYTETNSSFPYDVTTFYRLYQANPRAGAASARAAQATPTLAAQLKLTGATVRRVGTIKLKSNTSATVKGLIATGSGNGNVPKGTPKRYQAAMKTLASGRFALKFSGAASLDSSTISLRGSGTMLVRSRKSRRTQMCLSVSASRAGGDSRFTVKGATGKARGFFASGTGPALSFDGDSGRTAAISLKPRKGKARKLSSSCRSLSRVLDGKLPKAKQRKKR